MHTNDERVDQLIKRLSAFAQEVYRDLGSGFEERVYVQALLVCLREEGIKYEHEKVVAVHFRGFSVGEGYADIVIKCCECEYFVVEAKAVQAGKLGDAEKAQTKKYMTLLGANHGLLINFPQLAKDQSKKGTCDVEFVPVTLRLPNSP